MFGPGKSSFPGKLSGGARTNCLTRSFSGSSVQPGHESGDEKSQQVQRGRLRRDVPFGRSVVVRRR